MDPLLTVAAVLLAVGALVYTLSVPSGTAPAARETDSPARHLEQRKAAIYDSLRDLVFEFRTGKLSEADYQATRQELQRELAAVRAELERLAGKRSRGVAGGAEAVAVEPAAPVTAVAAGEPASGAVQCPSCGARFNQPMKFCGECGKPLGAGAS